MSLIDSTLVVRVVHDQQAGIDTAHLHVSGELDALSAATFRSTANQALADGTVQLLVDLSEVSFLDSSGLRAIIGVRNDAASRDVLMVVGGMSPAAEKVLELTGLIESLKAG